MLPSIAIPSCKLLYEIQPPYRRPDATAVDRGARVTHSVDLGARRGGSTAALVETANTHSGKYPPPRLALAQLGVALDQPSAYAPAWQVMRHPLRP
jgi:hypothetical protein